MDKIREYTERAVQISQEIRDLSADFIAEGAKYKYSPMDLAGLDDAIASIEGRTKLLNEALFELGWTRWTRKITRSLHGATGPLRDK